MKFLLILSFCLCAITSAKDNTHVLNKALTNQKLNTEEIRQLIKLVLRKNSDFQKLMENGLSDEASERAKKLLPLIRERPREDAGENRLGSAIGWFIEYQGAQMTAFPIVTKVNDGTPAQLAKLHEGDVLWKLEGESLHHEQARNHFIQLLHIWPTGTTMNFEIRREKSKHRRAIEYFSDRRTKFKISVTLTSE